MKINQIIHEAGTGLEIDRSIPGRTIARISGDVAYRTGSPSGKKLPDYHPDDDYTAWSGKTGASTQDDEEDTFDVDYTGDDGELKEFVTPQAAAADLEESGGVSFVGGSPRKSGYKSGALDRQQGNEWGTHGWDTCADWEDDEEGRNQQDFEDGYDLGFKGTNSQGVAEGKRDTCPPATQDIKLNLKNRQKAINEFGYGPLNPDMPNQKFWMKKAKEWQLDDPDEAKQSLCGNCAAFNQSPHMLDCIEQGIGKDSYQDPLSTIEAGDLGYCEFLKFKCASRRTCDAWVTGGPITTDKQGVAEGTTSLPDPNNYDSDNDYRDALDNYAKPQNDDSDYENWALDDTNEGKEKVGNMDADAFDAALSRMKKLAGAGPLKTVYDPNKRVYRNVPTAVQPAQQPRKK